MAVLNRIGKRIGGNVVLWFVWVCLLFFFGVGQSFNLVAFLSFSLGQDFIAQIHPAHVVWLCFDFQWSSFLSRNSLKKKK